MQDRYVGDIGDFGKYLLLKNISVGMKLGVNWCYVNSDDNSKSNDGKHIRYLIGKSDLYYNSDKSLFCKLHKIVTPSNNLPRTIESVQKSEILPSDTQFFSEEIKSEQRFVWHDESLVRLDSCDIIFYDPDNGLEVKSKGILHEDSKKYVFFNEIRDTYNRGKAVVVYQHNNMNKSVCMQINERVTQLKNHLSIVSDDKIVVIKGNRRFYLIIKNKYDNQVVKKIESNIDKVDQFVNTNILKVIKQ